MVRLRSVRAFTTAVMVALLPACAPTSAPTRPPAAGAAGLQLRFEDALAPGVFERTGLAVAEPPDGAAGLWAVVPGLPRPERARIENLGTGATTDVALFAGRGPRGAIRVSAEAAAALGLGATAATVRVTALRREPRIAPP